MATFLDSGFYLGLVHPKDKNRERSLALLADLEGGQFGLLYTSNYIMAEAATLAAVRSRNDPRVIALIRSYFTGDLQVATLLQSSPVDDESTWNLFEKVNETQSLDQSMSFADCSSIVLCQQHQIESIIAFDGHFQGWLQQIW
jgi:predicted nucleic acid-binding protein